MAGRCDRPEPDVDRGVRVDDETLRLATEAREPRIGLGLAAFGAGAGYVALSPEKWVFTLGAIGAIADAALGRWGSILNFAAFVGLTLSGSLAVLGFATLAPERSATVLSRVGGWLGHRSRAIAVVLGAVFGTWFLLKALSALGLV